ncbi:MAG: arsenate reductase (glutaredoxin) [Gammaproteobacteria bacterium]|nr:arsenate reductase (glutaredoxin) [Chromatiales bacterium]MYA32033.1 arsenate reductase (glutaredoxin) [Gammaproteobacteria bacterium]MYE49113.1 arsenate reductase (glutaredoxin) [Gammaproteobacteria bacterium]MYF67686.1 arsenate reductase (glutaredoxin) [Gammaproteobacteria bacterium]MYK36249.1 arsenate reductase (glutaredoxin) [Gammaproteobacteria bacterium]
MAVLYHNPRCSKSRAALALLQERDIDLEVLRYLENPPDEASLRDLLGQLGFTPLELMRRGEARYRELGLKAADVSDDERIRAMAENPILIERPIFVARGKAVVGRPPERVLELI